MSSQEISFAILRESILLSITELTHVHSYFGASTETLTRVYGFPMLKYNPPVSKPYKLLPSTASALSEKTQRTELDQAFKDFKDFKDFKIIPSYLFNKLSCF